jgi:hypothetical protein
MGGLWFAWGNEVEDRLMVVHDKNKWVMRIRKFDENMMSWGTWDVLCP